MLKYLKNFNKEVLHQSKPLPGSPFACESYDPTKLILQGVTRGQHAVHSPISFVCKFKINSQNVVFSAEF